MYTDDDLDTAIGQGIFDAESVTRFKQHIAGKASPRAVDEENFRLISGFNDIFVTIAALILMISAAWVVGGLHPSAAFAMLAVLSWLLSIFFISHRRLALPAILFLIAFVSSVTALSSVLLAAVLPEHMVPQIPLLGAFAVGTLAAWVHWLKFKVPITVAAGTASLIAGVISSVLAFWEFEAFGTSILNPLLFVCGVATFLLAMCWDAQDPTRTSRKSDVAFWLHLLAAPLIVHPIFSALGILGGENSVLSIALVAILYLLLGLVSIAVDRRALMVSALVYVLYAFSELLEAYGMVSISLAVSGVFIGSMLLLLSAFWHKSREVVVGVLPGRLRVYLPVLGG
ncbi:hypothetical protein [uncultured Halopseudomonas sp.]|uniref:hypothetical protein n=1 Tax=uncultured Halopseudomonas sp. TaxID=2901193 RepID=UPI0030EF7E42|tara:strand:- start:22837 stop:23862 length:1026 start_codon:yes stop_codon:yes gene_type:complete